LGIVTEVNPEQLRKASSPIEVTELGMISCASLSGTPYFAEFNSRLADSSKLAPPVVIKLGLVVVLIVFVEAAAPLWPAFLRLCRRAMIIGLVFVEAAALSSAFTARALACAISKAAAAANTTLGSEADRNALTSTTVTDNAVAYVASFAAGEGTGAITEAGIFNASSGGTLLCRTVFSVVNKGASDSMTITWTVTIS